MTGNLQAGKEEKEARNDPGIVQDNVARDLEQPGLVEDSLPMVRGWDGMMFKFLPTQIIPLFH